MTLALSLDDTAALFMSHLKTRCPQTGLSALGNLGLLAYETAYFDKHFQTSSCFRRHLSIYAQQTGFRGVTLILFVLPTQCLPKPSFYEARPNAYTGADADTLIVQIIRHTFRASQCSLYQVSCLVQEDFVELNRANHRRALTRA